MRLVSDVILTDTSAGIADTKAVEITIKNFGL
jgi:hypothetical protein